MVFMTAPTAFAGLLHARLSQAIVLKLKYAHAKEPKSGETEDDESRAQGSS